MVCEGFGRTDGTYICDVTKSRAFRRLVLGRRGIGLPLDSSIFEQNRLLLLFLHDLLLSLQRGLLSLIGMMRLVGVLLASGQASPCHYSGDSGSRCRCRLGMCGQGLGWSHVRETGVTCFILRCSEKKKARIKEMIMKEELSNT